MAWWQKKLLRFALSRTGLLDDNALNPDNLDIALGRQNVIDLKDVGLNIARISKLAQLPPGLRIETARILALKLTVPADIYQSSIIADFDGIELRLRLEDVPQTEERSRARSPVTDRSPQHRKVHRRIPSSPPLGHDGDDGDEVYIPTTEELAKSFLLEEPLQERRQLEASVALDAKGMEESFASESSASDDVGVGAGVGLPGFLAGFLQGIVDRLRIEIRNVVATLETELGGSDAPAVPVTLRLKVDAVALNTLDEKDNAAGTRCFGFTGISLDLSSTAGIFAECSDLTSPASPILSRQSGALSADAQSQHQASDELPPAPPNVADTFEPTVPQLETMRASVLTMDEDRFADAAGDEAEASSMTASYDIRPGDDNLSWGSRRSETDTQPQDLWKSMTSEDDLPQSLLFERLSGSRSHSTRGISPNTSRTRRNVSPYTRRLNSPGSWPKPDDRPTHRGLQPSPGSWPNLDQSMFQSMNLHSPRDVPLRETTDNKRVAVESMYFDAHAPDAAPPVANVDEEDLTTSRVFSHQEAQSMYMSAMSHDTQMHVPGGWGSEGTASERSVSPELPRTAHPQPLGSSIRHAPAQVSQSNAPWEEDLAYGDRPYQTPTAPLSGNITPRPRSPGRKTSLLDERRVSRELVHIDNITLTLPNVATEHSPRTETSDTGWKGSPLAGMPGTFSAYSDLASSRRHFRESAGPSGLGSRRMAKNAQDDSTGPESQAINVTVGTIRCQVDIPCLKLVYAIGLQCEERLRSSSKVYANSGQQRDFSMSESSLSVVVGALELNLRESASSSLQTPVHSRPALSLALDSIDFRTDGGEGAVRIGSFKTLIGDSCLLSFDRTMQPTASIVITSDTPDVALTLTNKGSVTRRAVFEMSVEALPVHLNLDLPAVDEALDYFGGLSGVLEAGSSMLSESGLASPPAKPSKGVRFEGEQLGPKEGSEMKLNARFGGLIAELQGSTCCIQLQTSTLKAVYREQGVIATMENAQLSGPVAPNCDRAPLTTNLSMLRLEYLLSPQDKDLERLLSLLTPSKDKYDDDNDILLDTLLRQRKKGAVMRISVDSAKVRCDDLTWLDTMMTLQDDLGRLSAVAKYLPEDDKPGMLLLLRIKNTELRVPVNDCFGMVHVQLSDVHCAQVGLPALLALSVGRIKASQEGNTRLMDSLFESPTIENLPVIMARMVGNEAEPSVKVKLYNMVLEYSVPVLLDLTSMHQEVETEQLVSKLAASVAELVAQRSSRGEDAPDASIAQCTQIDVLIHDSGIGLKPQSADAKALFVLGDASISTTLPPKKDFKVDLRLRKASLFVADQVITDPVELTTPSRGAPRSTAISSKLTSMLSRRGYVSVASMMSAHIIANLEGDIEKAVDVNVSTELLLLETCADSTQTLITVMNGLALPKPPSKQQRYLTEPMPIEDMMASFTGNAFSEPITSRQRLFDVEEQPEEDIDDMLGMPGSDEDDDAILAESGLTSSLYGPVSGILSGAGPSHDGDEEDYPATAESLLEDDPFEMTLTPADMPMSDAALLRELNKQCNPTSAHATIELETFEVDDLGYDALGGSQTVLGSRHRFAPPVSTGNRAAHQAPPQRFPFKLKLRNLHLIWNIYDGYDWQRTREGITSAVEQVEQRAEQRKAKRRASQLREDDDNSVIGDFLFHSIYIGVPNAQDAQDLRRQINRGIDDLATETESVPVSGMSRPSNVSASAKPRPRRRLKLERSKAHKVAFELKGVSADILVFPPDSTDVVSSVDVRVRDFEIFDNVPTSTWRKFLTSLNTDEDGREMAKPMMHIELLNVRTLEQYAASEITLHVFILPLRLHVDQDALDFITRFFEFKDESVAPPSTPGEQPFLQRVEVETVDLCLDYKPKKVDYAGLKSGHTNEFMNFVTLDAAKIRLKHAIIYGIHGFEPLHKTLNDIWMPDVKRNQLPTVLAGLAPVRSLANIGSGVRDVVAIPIREYKKDGRIFRSIQKGAFHFGKTTASELARLGAKMAIGTQNLLQGAEGMLSPATASPSNRSRLSRSPTSEPGWQDMEEGDEDREQRAISSYANQPLSVLSGLRSARLHLEHDLLTARDALIAVQGEVLESTTPGSAVAAVGRHAPTVILRPVIGTSRAVGAALLGIGNAIDRDNLKRIDDVSANFIRFHVFYANLWQKYKQR